MSNALRLYLPEELGADGYPPEWHKRTCDSCFGSGRATAYTRGKYAPKLIGEVDCPPCHGSGQLPIKKMIRGMAEHRCVRCLHPYRPGDDRISAKGEWSPCDEQCRHDGPMQAWKDGVPMLFRWQAMPSEEHAAEIRTVTAALRVEAHWRILTVHHLDGNKANCRWWNLAALCQRCHLQIQGKVQMARVWPWEHTDWFKPYVAGYYAHVYLKEDVNPVMAMERLDELLALERFA